jgi:hypothetical protein
MTTEQLKEHVRNSMQHNTIKKPMEVKMKIVELESKQLTAEENPNGAESETICHRYWCKVKVENEREYVSVSYGIYRTPDEMPHPTAEEFGEFVLVRLTHEDIQPDASTWQLYKEDNKLDELIKRLRR